MEPGPDVPSDIRGREDVHLGLRHLQGRAMEPGTIIALDWGLGLGVGTLALT